MDICVEYMQDLSGVIDQGSLVAIYSATQIATQQGVNYIPKNLPVSNPKTRWLFVKGVPDSWSGTLITIAMLNAALSEFNSDNGGWNFWNEIPQSLKNNLTNDGYDTVTFAQFKGYLRNKSTNQFLSEIDLLA